LALPEIDGCFFFFSPSLISQRQSGPAHFREPFGAGNRYFLAPPPPVLGFPFPQKNDRSCTLRFKFFGKALIRTGCWAYLFSSFRSSPSWTPAKKTSPQLAVEFFSLSKFFGGANHYAFPPPRFPPLGAAQFPPQACGQDLLCPARDPFFSIPFTTARLRPFFSISGLSPPPPMAEPHSTPPAPGGRGFSPSFFLAVPRSTLLPFSFPDHPRKGRLFFCCLCAFPS